MKKLAFVCLTGVVAMAAPSAAAACGYATDAAVEVKWNGEFYQAAILSCDGAKSSCLIHYAGFSDSWDENAKCDRIRAVVKPVFETGDAALIVWKSTWYPGSVKSIDGDRYCITYDNYNARWDECVPRWRLKPAPEAPLDLGLASVRLRVKDLTRSRAFYAKLGFEVVTDHGKKGLLMARAGLVIDLVTDARSGDGLAFQTPNVGAVEKHLTARGVAHEVVTDDARGPAKMLVVMDPDGHRIVIDQKRRW